MFAGEDFRPSRWAEGFLVTIANIVCLQCVTICCVPVALHCIPCSSFKTAPWCCSWKRQCCSGGSPGRRRQSRRRSASAARPACRGSQMWRRTRPPGQPSQRCTCGSGNPTWRTWPAAPISLGRVCSFFTNPVTAARKGHLAWQRKLMRLSFLCNGELCSSLGKAMQLQQDNRLHLALLV